MSNEPMAPHFDDHFWNNVQIRVENVRDLTRAELAQAAHDLLAVEVEAEVVPVFPSPFWNRVNKRAASVRTMALDELADAEERLVNGPEAAVPSWRSRIPVPAMLRRIPRPRQAGLPLRARVNTLGFVTAVLAVLLLLPQVMPISSLAEVRTRGPLSIFFSDQTGGNAPTSDKEPDSGTTSTRSAANESGKADGSSGGKSTTSSPGLAKSSEKAGSSGGTESGPSTPADTGSSEVGAAGESKSGTASTSEPAAAGVAGEAPAARPEAPSNLLLTAIDDKSVRLRWRDRSSNETNFAVERSGDPAGPRVLGANIKNFIWTGLAANSQACFRVKARNEAGDSPWLPADYKCVKTHEAKTAEGPVVLQALACSNESGLSGGPNQQETQIQFVNQTGHAVRIYSMEEGVRGRTPIVVPAGGSAGVNTFLGDPFVVTNDDEAASCLAIYLGRSWTGVANITDPA
jgi:hypothetical protein